MTVSIKYGAPSSEHPVCIPFHALVSELCFLAVSNDMLVLVVVVLLHAH